MSKPAQPPFSNSPAPNLKRYREIVSVFARHGFDSFLADVQPEHRISLPSRLLKQRRQTPHHASRTSAPRPGRIMPNPWEGIRAVLVEQMGSEPEQFFEQIDPIPLGAASLAHVHAATRKVFGLPGYSMSVIAEDIDRGVLGSGMFGSYIAGPG
jgi:hypothetical protein